MTQETALDSNDPINEHPVLAMREILNNLEGDDLYEALQKEDESVQNFFKEHQPVLSAELMRNYVQNQDRWDNDLVTSQVSHAQEAGQALGEYALLLGLIAVACLVTLGALGLAISGMFEDITTALG